MVNTMMWTVCYRADGTLIEQFTAAGPHGLSDATNFFSKKFADLNLFALVPGSQKIYFL